MTKKCEMRESLSASHVEAVTQQLPQAMSLHWALRLGGDIRAASLGLSQAQEKTLGCNCGVKIRSNKKLCSNCAKQATRKNFRAGRRDAQQPESLAKRSATQRQHKQAIQNWKAPDLPGWLTRDVYIKRILPALAHVAKSRIRLALGVSEPYSSDIQAGKRIPHSRHWQALAELAGVPADVHDAGRRHRGGESGQHVAGAESSGTAAEVEREALEERDRL